MAHPAYLRDKARELRTKQKLPLLEIAERLALPKTTVFYWIRDLPDPEIKHQRKSNTGQLSGPTGEASTAFSQSERMTHRSERDCRLGRTKRKTDG
jgi:hypothetical protein